MNVSDFNYDLPAERIAQQPVEPRDQAKLLVLNRQAQTLEDRHVFDLPSFFRPGDLLVFNDSKVFKARLRAKCDGRVVEIFLLRPICHFEESTDDEKSLCHFERSEKSLCHFERSEKSPEFSPPVSRRNDTSWLALAKPGRKLSSGLILELADGTRVTVGDKQADGTVALDFGLTPDQVFALADKFGEVPTPPYVKTQIDNPAVYQTVYAKHIGSVAAPTAGFHFTERLLDELRTKGVKTAFVTLHVGLGTFRPMKTETLEEHEMHEEWASVPDETKRLITETKKNGGRVIAVGTTTVRALESALDQPGFTRLFITPGYQFKTIDALITNFHLPKSTLLVLVSSFAGREFILSAYAHAIANGYRFYSFGDAMLIE